MSFEFVPHDLARIDLSDVYELRYWVRELRVSEGRLRAAVAAAGPRLAAVQKYLGIHDAPASTMPAPLWTRR
ncbi:DUF3606 domain-containing protein [Variovorax sp. J22R24]|uniref:DUF3606 domain-containing protein n=1 Tax=Variovorax gracilis TaxID=3053502 RepID=UPI0025788F6C|nr:DUF3606 domain-containing protein [Variovorax sp. J22R24]MDM0109337.1 DUF3606 domain-containing protein [Variovorax sp. J22R24]